MSAPVTWDGSAYSAVEAGSVSIFCIVAPSVAWTIESGPTQATTSATTVVATTSTGITTGSTIAGVGRYDLAGGAFGAQAIGQSLAASVRAKLQNLAYAA